MRLVNRRPSRGTQILLASIPFLLLIGAYVIGSAIRLADNPADKLMPSLQAMGNAIAGLAFEPDKRTGDYLLWTDTLISLWRLGVAMAISFALAFVVGIAAGFIPYAQALLASFVSAFSLIPPIAVLPILFIVVGLDETSKITLIAIGTAPLMIRSVSQAAAEIPRELIIKAQTLGASTWQMILRVVTPQILPRLLTATRLALVPGWIFLICAEAIASTDGLGYRIFLVRRFLAMDVILPYVIWITILAFVMDRALLLLQRWMSPWQQASAA